MKLRKSLSGGFTLVEVLVVTGIIGLASGIIFLVLDTGMKLYAKNTSVNLTHDQARVAYLQMMQDVQGAVSLITSDGSAVAVAAGGYSSTGQAISFQVLKGGPFVLSGTVNAGDTTVTIAIPSTFNFTPVHGQRLIIPSFSIEAEITGVTGTSGTTATLALFCSGTYSSGVNSSGITTAITPTTNGTSNYFGCFITDRVTYLVSGTPSGSNLGTWFASLYPTASGTWNQSYANLIGSGTNDFYYVYHNSLGNLTAVKVAHGLVNPLNLGQALAPFVLNTTSALSTTLTSSSLTSSNVVVGNIVTADTLHYSTIISGTNMNVNGLNISGTAKALVFSRGVNSIGMNMCITGGTLQMINWETQIAQDRPH